MAYRDAEEIFEAPNAAHPASGVGARLTNRPAAFPWVEHSQTSRKPPRNEDSLPQVRGASRTLSMVSSKELELCEFPCNRRCPANATRPGSGCQSP